MAVTAGLHTPSAVMTGRDYPMPVMMEARELSRLYKYGLRPACFL